MSSCTLTAPAARTSHTGVVWEVTEERVRLAFDRSGVREELHPRAIALLTFSDARGTASCLTRVLESSEKGVSLEAPRRVVAIEGRLSFRVPLRGEHGLHVALVLPDGSSVGAQAINISTGGVLLELQAPLVEGAAAELKLSLEREGRAIVLPVVAKHRVQSRLGLAFQLERERQGEPVVPATLRELVSGVQRRWLQTLVPRA